MVTTECPLPSELKGLGCNSLAFNFQLLLLSLKGSALHAALVCPLSKGIKDLGPSLSLNRFSLVAIQADQPMQSVLLLAHWIPSNWVFNMPGYDSHWVFSGVNQSLYSVYVITINQNLWKSMGTLGVPTGPS